MTIYQQLKKEHKDVKDLLERIEKGSGPVDDLFSRLDRELSIHMEGEEKLLYPPLMSDEKMKERVLEAYEEHHVVKTLLGELNSMPKDDERWMAKIKVMQENIDHHVKEEEGDIFEGAQEVLDRSQEEEILKMYEEEKQKQMATVL